MKYRKKAVVIDAIQIPCPTDTFVQWCKETGFTNFTSEQDGIKIPTLEGEMKASLGDYIIKGVKGEFYPCKPDIFQATYDKVEEEEASPVSDGITQE